MTYRFDAMPRAVRMAIPRSYDGALFEGGAGKASEPDGGIMADAAWIGRRTTG